MAVTTTTTTMGAEDNAEDREAKELMKQWGVDGDVEINDDDIDNNDNNSKVDAMMMDPDAALERYRRNVAITPDNAVDQIYLGTCNLEKAVDQFEKLTGTRPVWVTSMNGAGTKSARVAFESCAYLEIIGPDPKQRPGTAFSEALSRLRPDELVPVHYSVRSNKSSDVNTRAEWKKNLGLKYDLITAVAKDKGMPWMWDMVFFQEQNGIYPFFTCWNNAMHGCAKLPIVGILGRVKVTAPADHLVHELLDDEPHGMDVNKGSSPRLEFSFTSSKGNHTFSSPDPIGISFPAEGGLPVRK